MATPTPRSSTSRLISAPTILASAESMEVCSTVPASRLYTCVLSSTPSIALCLLSRANTGAATPSMPPPLRVPSSYPRCYTAYFTLAARSRTTIALVAVAAPAEPPRIASSHPSTAPTTNRRRTKLGACLTNDGQRSLSCCKFLVRLQLP